MGKGLNNYFGIDFGTTSSAVVGYMVMDHKPEKFLYGDGFHGLFLLVSRKGDK